jgi:hypothetical protein
MGEGSGPVEGLEVTMIAVGNCLTRHVHVERHRLPAGNHSIGLPF